MSVPTSTRHSEPTHELSMQHSSSTIVFSPIFTPWPSCADTDTFGCNTASLWISASPTITQSGQIIYWHDLERFERRFLTKLGEIQQMIVILVMHVFTFKSHGQNLSFNHLLAFNGHLFPHRYCAEIRTTAASLQVLRTNLLSTSSYCHSVIIINVLHHDDP